MDYHINQELNGLLVCKSHISILLRSVKVSSTLIKSFGHAYLNLHMLPKLQLSTNQMATLCPALEQEYGEHRMETTFQELIN